MNRYEAYQYASRPLDRRRANGMLSAAIKCFFVALMLLVAMILINCGTTTLQKIGGVNSAAITLTSVVRPMMDSRCEARARECVAGGVKDPEKCEPWVKCRDARRMYYDAIAGVHMAAAEAAIAASLGKSHKMADILARCQAAIEVAQKIVDAQGWLR